jgi:uncharacterized protein YutE (UPF0331/DUF86 family)
MEKMLKTANNAKDISALGAALKEIDWKEATPETLINKLDELGITSKMTTTELEALINLMTDGVVKVTNIGKTYSELLKTLQDSDNIEEESYLKMAELGLSSYFK